MNKVFKAGSALWITLSIISLFSAGGLLYFMLQERTQRIETEQKLSETEKAKRAVEIKLDHTQLELIQFKDQAVLLAKQFEEEKKKYLAVLEQVEKKDSQIKELDNSLANEKKQSTNLANVLAQLRENYGTLEERLKQAKLKTEEIKQHLGKSTRQSEVELKKIVIKPKPKKELSGKVLVVNNEFHFVVIDLGRKNGVSVGDELGIYEGSEEIGKVQVEKVYDAMATASILSGSQEHKIGEGSSVKSF